MEETIFEELNRFVDSINSEIRADKPDMVSIDFWLFKIKNRIRILKKYCEETKNYEDQTVER